jgi:hypothetical protein
MLTSIGLCDVVLKALGTKLRQATRPRENQALVFRTKRGNQRTIWIADAHRDGGGANAMCRPKNAPAWSNEPEPGHNRGDDLAADDTQLPSVGL